MVAWADLLDLGTKGVHDGQVSWEMYQKTQDFTECQKNIEGKIDDEMREKCEKLGYDTASDEQKANKDTDINA